ncbi:Penicillin amidase [Chitinophaga rupis]|uniref:Penicillin amidase n=1 Tax=Chitinophaga rupis TaxID=573321 RepID=A0A1H7YAR7_9BACT|nr:Penicillin amidase [Chitinophaga rupis]
MEEPAASRIDIPEAAKQPLKVINANPLTKEALTAYTKGVNAYIHQLSYCEIPLERNAASIFREFFYLVHPQTR